jgi:hypothetical protein
MRQATQNALLPSRMRLALAGKHRVRPLVLFLWRGNGTNHGLRFTPASRSRLNAPDIRRLFQRETDQPILPSRSQRNTIRDASRRARSPRKFVEQNRQARFQRPAEPYAASLGIYDQSMAVLAEWNRRIQADKSKRNLRPNSGTAPCRFVGCHTRTHMRTLFNCTSRTNPRSPAPTQIQTKVTTTEAAAPRRPRSPGRPRPRGQSSAE